MAENATVIDANIQAVAAPEDYRQAPHNIEAEQALLGAILVNNEAYFRVNDYLKSSHFYEPLHKQIFEVVAELINSNKIANPVTIKTFLPENERIGEITVAQYLARLAGEAPTIINAGDYGQSIYDLSIRRDLITIGEDMVNIAYDAPVDLQPVEQIENVERSLFSLAESGRAEQGFIGFGQAITEAIDMAAEAYNRDGGLSGISSGISSLDRKMGGLQRSDFIVLAGRPGMGKTALATNLALNIAKAYEGKVQADGSTKAEHGGVVGFFSLEMSAEQLATRIISSVAGVSSSKIRRGDITDQDYNALKGASHQINQYPLFIDQTGGISIAQLAARARRLKRQRGLDVMVVDYIQLMQGSGKNQGNRVQEVTEITTGLKALAKELDVPIIALSQLSRAVESREDKRPQLSDLRESGSIEQDADVVLFVFREEYYVQQLEPDQGDGEKYSAWMEKMERAHGKGEVIIAKQRHGPTGQVHLAFEAEFTRFSDLANDAHLPERM